MSAIETSSSVATSKPYLLSMNLAAFRADSPQPSSLNRASVTTAILNVDFGPAGLPERLAKAAKAMTVSAMGSYDAGHDCIGSGSCHSYNQCRCKIGRASWRE